MKKSFFAAAAFGLAVSLVPALMGAAQAAPSKSQFCDLAKTQKNLVSWNAYYHCLGPAPRHARVEAQPRLAHAKSSYCDLAKTQKNLVAWNAYYGCLSR